MEKTENKAGSIIYTTVQIHGSPASWKLCPFLGSHHKDEKVPRQVNKEVKLFPNVEILNRSGVFNVEKTRPRFAGGMWEVYKFSTSMK